MLSLIAKQHFLGCRSGGITKKQVERTIVLVYGEKKKI